MSETHVSSVEVEVGISGKAPSSSLSTLWPPFVVVLRSSMLGMLVVAFILICCLAGTCGHTSLQSRRLHSLQRAGHSRAFPDHASIVELPQVGAGSGSSDSKCQNVYCGTVRIPYPFGISQECARNSAYLLKCYDESLETAGEYAPLFRSPAPGFWPYLTNVSGFVRGFYYPASASGVRSVTRFKFNVTEFQVLNVSSTGTLIINSTDFKATSCSGVSKPGNASLVFRPDTPYRISHRNLVFVAGCRSEGFFGTRQTGSRATCGPNSCINQFTFDFCNFYDCCASSISTTSKLYLSGSGTSYAQYDTCGYASVLYEETFQNQRKDIFGSGTYGLEIVWGLQVPNRTQFFNCDAIKSLPDYGCSERAECNLSLQAGDLNPGGFYYCQCSVPGYEGDGYLNGTQCNDTNECLSSSLNNCTAEATCTNLDGSYNCSCPSSLMKGNGIRVDVHGGTGCEYIDFCKEDNNDCAPGAICTRDSFGHYNCTCSDQLEGDGYVNGTGCKSKGTENTALVAGVSLGAALVFALINCVACIYVYKRWKQHYLQESFGPDFSRDDFLRDIQNSEGANICRLFSYAELSNATNNFSNDNVLGTGGFGTVFKGTLDDGLKMAIKKAKHDVGEGRDETKQFINEVTILSQVNHRNLVKLLGCCLETPVPVLIYEFVPNGTLSDHLRPDPGHDRTGSRKADAQWLPLDWNHRLKIAVGTAEGLAYLHSGTSPPIYHRDVKSANILLDHNFMAKVADFGLSKLVSLEATHLSTALQGTPGYLDPDYFDNYQITDKSDVYSFGVVLLELITAEKPVDLSRQPKDHNLALRCGRLWQHGRLADIIDPLLGASSDLKMLESILGVAKVALQCVGRHREDRPTMQEALEELKSIARVSAVVNFPSPVPIRRRTETKVKIPKNVRFEDDSEFQPLTEERFSSDSSFSEFISTSPGSSRSNSSSSGMHSHFDGRRSSSNIVNSSNSSSNASAHLQPIGRWSSNALSIGTDNSSAAPSRMKSFLSRWSLNDRSLKSP